MNLLIAEDDSVTRLTLSACLRSWGYEVTALGDGLQAFEILAKPNGPRLALLDWEMPGLDGTEVCEKLRAIRNLPFRYLILLTGHDSEESIVTALAKGADDYITKPWKPGELRARLGVGQRTIQIHEQLEEQTRQLALAAQTDYLTRIWNRSAVIGRLEAELSRAERENASLSVFMMDADHFKLVNDTYGHTAGDQVLIEIAHRLREACRPYDIVGRYGGEEFLAVIWNASFEATQMLAERFREIVAAKTIRAENIMIPVTISLGATWKPPALRMDIRTIVNEADKMLYQAKESGRNRVILCSLSDAEDASSNSNDKEALN